MQLTVKPYHTNSYPRGGILVRGSRVTDWLQQVQFMRLSLEDLFVYPVAGTMANSVWGCLLVPRFVDTALADTAWSWPADIGPNTWYQCIREGLFLPENSRLYPQLSVAGLDKLLKGKLHFYHPETGWVELPEPVRWADLLVIPAGADRTIFVPEETVVIPSRAYAFYKQSISPEEALDQLASESWPGELPDGEPLSVWEKIKQRLQRFLFGARARKGDPTSREIERLLTLFKKDPAEALKYAIPIDNEGRSRGGDGHYLLSRLWANFPLSGNWLEGIGGAGQAAGGSVRVGKGQLSRLNEEYRNTAYDLLQKGDYRQAAFVYLRLLKDYYSGANALEKGEFYAEAAAINLKYLNNKLRAAECYEKGRMTMRAIELYIELEQYEKAGDLYLSIGKKKEAGPWYEKVVAQYLSAQDYSRAALIQRAKLEDPEKAQALLLEGWRNDKNAVNCLCFYFAALEPDVRQLGSAIKRIYEEETGEKNNQQFLQVLKQQLHHTGIQDIVRDIAYAIVASRIGEDPAFVKELQAFNQKDKRLFKDILLYRQQRSAT